MTLLAESVSVPDLAKVPYGLSRHDHRCHLLRLAHIAQQASDRDMERAYYDAIRLMEQSDGPTTEVRPCAERLDGSRMDSGPAVVGKASTGVSAVPSG